MKKFFLVFVLFFGINFVNAKDLDWENFVKAYSKSDYVKIYEKLNGAIEIKSTDNELIIKSKDLTTKFTYNDGVLTFVPSNNEKTAFMDTNFVDNAILTLSNLKNYNSDKVFDYLDSNKDFNIVYDGIAFTKKEIVKNTDTSHSSITTYSSFKLDLKNGLSHFNQSNIQNPQTGVSRFGMELLFILGIFILGYFKTYKYNKFPQA